MKTLLVIAGLIALCGCSLFSSPKSGDLGYKKDGESVAITFAQPEASKESTTFEFEPSGGVRIVFGAQYNVEKIRAAYKAFAKYHVAAIVLIIAGVAMRVSKIIPNKWSYASAGTGVGLGVFGHLVPSASPWTMLAAGVAVVVCGLYAIWRKGLLSPVPE